MEVRRPGVSQQRHRQPVSDVGGALHPRRNAEHQGQASGAYTQQARRPGELEDKRQQGVAILNELVASLAVRDNFYLDLGKLRHTSGYLFSRAPLDLLRNVSGGLRTARVYATGDSWRGLYDEGSYGAGGTLYRKEGTYTLAVLPRLKRFPPRREAASEWDALLRTNGSERYYASYTSTGLNTFNPTVSLLAGQQKRWRWEPAAI